MDPTQELEDPPLRFAPERLARLMELTSKVQCECPNHVARIVEALLSFEAYSRGCASRNEADRALHRSLNRSSVRARLIMEQALAEIVAFERLEL